MVWCTGKEAVTSEDIPRTYAHVYTHIAAVAMRRRSFSTLVAHQKTLVCYFVSTSSVIPEAKDMGLTFMKYGLWKGHGFCI